jgi:hypothetical protein
VCEHLDRFLKYDPASREKKPEIVFIEDVEKKPWIDKEEPGQVWELFKKLRRHGLKNDQIGILIREFGYNMTREQIMRDMGWSSVRMYVLRYNAALVTLRKRGFSK